MFRSLYICGPPGTGKTFIARRLAAVIAGGKERVEFVQFQLNCPALQPTFAVTLGPQVAEVAALRADPPLRALARDGNLASIRALSPSTAGTLDATLARIGHRGPGEAELCSPTFSENPTMQRE